jgi:hypothetical protein
MLSPHRLMSRTYVRACGVAVRRVTGRRVLLLALAALAAGCAARHDPAAAEQRVPEQAGRVTRVGSFGYGIVPDADPGTRYAPDSLPREFQQDGLRVLFAGVLSSPPPGVRMWGTPLRLTSIRRVP